MLNLQTKDDFTTAINSEWRNAFASIIRVGALLRTAANQIGKREFHIMLTTDLPFSRRTAEKLMDVAADKRITSKKYASVLPPHWTTLHELTYLDNDTFKHGVDIGIITADVERSQIIELKKTQQPSSKQNSSKSAGIGAAEIDNSERVKVATLYSKTPLAKWQEDDLQKMLEELIGKSRTLSYEQERHKPVPKSIKDKRDVLAADKRNWLEKRSKGYNKGVKQDYVDLMIDAMYQRKSDRLFVVSEDEEPPYNDIRNLKNPFYGMNFKEIWNIAREKKIITPYSGIETIDYEAFIQNLILQHCEGSNKVREDVHKTLMRRTKSRNPRNAKLAKAAIKELVI